MLIGLNGKKGSGKDTVYERMSARLPKATVERRAFADLMYESAAASLGVDVGVLREWKNDPDALLMVTTPDLVRPITVREYVQKFGTEGHRDIFGEDFWVRRLDLSHERRIVVVTDVRMPNEAEAILEAGGVVIRVHGPFEVESADDDHATEAELPHTLVDGAIYNDARDDGFESLDRQVLDLVLGLLREERVAGPRFTV